MLKESACNVGDMGSTPGLGTSPGEGKGYPLQYSGLENSTDCIIAKSRTWLSDFFTLERWVHAAKFTIEGDENFYGDFDRRYSTRTGIRKRLTRKNSYTEHPIIWLPSPFIWYWKLCFFSVAWKFNPEKKKKKKNQPQGYNNILTKSIQKFQGIFPCNTLKYLW